MSFAPPLPNLRPSEKAQALLVAICRRLGGTTSLRRAGSKFIIECHFESRKPDLEDLLRISGISGRIDEVKMIIEKGRAYLEIEIEGTTIRAPPEFVLV